MRGEQVRGGDACLVSISSTSVMLRATSLSSPEGGGGRTHLVSISSASMILSATSLSSPEVGSSAKMMNGSLTRSTARLTRRF